MLIWKVEALYTGLRNPHVQLTSALLVLMCRLRQIKVGQSHLTLRQAAAGLFGNASLWIEKTMKKQLEIKYSITVVVSFRQTWLIHQHATFVLSCKQLNELELAKARVFLVSFKKIFKIKAFY